MNLDQHGVTWACHVCGRTRPDSKIAVYTESIAGAFNLRAGVLTQNVRYCIDSETCKAGAPRRIYQGKRGD